MYEAIDNRIEVLVRPAILVNMWILVGGIFINGDKEMGSFVNIKIWLYQHRD